jgi:hypothetical protein
VMLGADWAGRLLFAEQPWLGVIMLLALAVGVAAAALGALVLLRQRTVPSYAVLREKLRTLKGAKLGKDEILGLHRELRVIDTLHGGEPARPVAARPVAVPTGLASLARTDPWRLLPTALGAVVFAVVLIAAVGTGDWILAVLAVLVPVASFLLGRSSARVRRLAREAWNEVYRKQRAEAVAELDELERRASRGVPGLSDRVSRALRILREQQG